MTIRQLIVLLSAHDGDQSVVISVPPPACPCGDHEVGPVRLRRSDGIVSLQLGERAGLDKPRRSC
jgi:hypothetical protein